jgi:hypothetical protein
MLFKIALYIYFLFFILFIKKIGCPMLKVDSLVAQSFVLGSFFLGLGMWV